MRGFATARLLADPVTQADLPFLLALWSDSRVARTLGGPRDAEQAGRVLGAAVRHWHDHGFGRWILRCDGSAVGTVKLARCHVLAATIPVGGSPLAAAAGGVWGTAREIPGIAALNTKGDAVLFDVSCGAAGSCSAGGFYEDSAGFHAFVVSQEHGTWGKAQPVPGLSALDKRDGSEVDTVSCAAAGSCSAGGDYIDSAGFAQAFVVDEVHGTWRRAQRVHGVAALASGGISSFDSVSCSAAGDCSAAGGYVDGAGRGQGFVVGEADGIWGTARPVPGLAALNTGESGGPDADASIGPSCAAPGDCGASGGYTDSAGHFQGVVADEVHGTWRRVRPVPGLAALNTGGLAEMGALSCAAPGDCSAGGFYLAGRDKQGFGVAHAFTMDEVQGTWRRVRPVPGLAALNTGGSAGISSMSCAAVGQCSATGFYDDRAGNRQAFVVAERKGTWRRAQQVPGLAALNKGGDAYISVSCSAAGDWGAAGIYTDGAGRSQPFVVDEVHGHWHRARQVPGTAALNKGHGAGSADLAALSCAPAGSCSAGGSYTDGAGHRQVFIVSKR